MVNFSKNAQEIRSFIINIFKLMIRIISPKIPFQRIYYVRWNKKNHPLFSLVLQDIIISHFE